MKSTLLLLCVVCVLQTIGAKEYKNTIIINPKKASPEWIIRETIKAGIDKRFDYFYDELKHEDFSMRRDERDFLWQSLVKWAPSYIINVKKHSYKIVRTDPAKITKKDTYIKYFLHSSQRDNPVPIIVKKDRYERWRVANMSL